MIRERCHCGAEIETDDEEAVAIWAAWREAHDCPGAPVDDRPLGGVAQVEQAPDYTLPELHIGFRA